MLAGGVGRAKAIGSGRHHPACRFEQACMALTEAI